MSVTPDAEKSQPSPPDPYRVQPSMALAVAGSIAGVTGVMAGWMAAITVLVAVLELFVAYRDLTQG